MGKYKVVIIILLILSLLLFSVGCGSSKKKQWEQWDREHKEREAAWAAEVAAVKPGYYEWRMEMYDIYFTMLDDFSYMRREILSKYAFDYDPGSLRYNTRNWDVLIKELIDFIPRIEHTANRLETFTMGSPKILQEEVLIHLLNFHMDLLETFYGPIYDLVDPSNTEIQNRSQFYTKMERALRRGTYANDDEAYSQYLFLSTKLREAANNFNQRVYFFDVHVEFNTKYKELYEQSVQMSLSRTGRPN